MRLLPGKEVPDMPLSLPKDCVRETGVIDISRFLGLWTGDAVDLDRDSSQAGPACRTAVIVDTAGAVTASVVPSSA